MINVVNKKQKARKISKPTHIEKVETSGDDINNDTTVTDTNEKEVAESTHNIAEYIADEYVPVNFNELKEAYWVLAYYEYDKLYFLRKFLQISTGFCKAKVVCFKLSYGNGGRQTRI